MEGVSGLIWEVRLSSRKSRDRGSLKWTLVSASDLWPLSLWQLWDIVPSRTRETRNWHLISSNSETWAGQNHTMTALIHEVFCFASIRYKVVAFDARAIDENTSNIIIGDLQSKSGRVEGWRLTTDLQCSQRCQIFRRRFATVIVEHVISRYDDRVCVAIRVLWRLETSTIY